MMFAANERMSERANFIQSQNISIFDGKRPKIFIDKAKTNLMTFNENTKHF